VLWLVRASPDVLLGTIAVHFVHYKVAGDTAKEGIGCDVTTKVTKLPANNFSILWGGNIITDRPTVEHDVAFMRSRSPDQLNHWCT